MIAQSQDTRIGRAMGRRGRQTSEQSALGILTSISLKWAREEEAHIDQYQPDIDTAVRLWYMLTPPQRRKIGMTRPKV